MRGHSIMAAVLACGIGIAGQASHAHQGAPSLESRAPQQLAAVPLTSADLEFLLGAASYAYAGMAAAELALSRTDAPRLRSLAQGMLEDHRAAASRLREIAEARTVALPRGTTNEQRLVLAGLRSLHGQAFERDFLQRAAINEHREFIALLHRQATEPGRDPDLVRFATAMLWKLRGHLSVAQWLHDRSMAMGPATAPGG